MLIKFSFPADDFKFQEIGKAFPSLITGDQFDIFFPGSDNVDTY